MPIQNDIEKYRDLSNHEGIVYSFMTERGRQDYSYAEYLADTQLRGWLADPSRYRLVLGRTIFSYQPKYLSSHRQIANMLRKLEDEQQKNPLRFFAPSGLEATAFINDFENSLCILTACNRYGKALDDDTLIPTPNGDKRMGDLREGDFVYGGDGYLCTVTGVFPQGEKECFEVVFDNGEVSLVASGDHLWKYLRHNRAFKSRSRKHFDEWEVLTTDEILSLQGCKSTSQTRGYIPLAAVPNDDNHDATLPISPYSLGAIIGDGSVSGRDVRISSADMEVIKRLEGELGAKANHYGGYDYGLTGCGIAKKIREIGMQGKRSWEKYIPEQYLLAPTSDRIDLLRGLMDTDGCKSFRAGEYWTVSKQLSEDVSRLVRSLGGSAKTSVCQKHYTYKGEKRSGRIAYRVRVLMWDINPFWLKRKSESWEAPTRRRGRLVYDIKPVSSRKCTCISVNSSDHTFLAGDYIVTHNTQSMLIKKLINSIPCDPKWEIFTKYGVKWRPFTGPKVVGMASYDLGFHRDTSLKMLLSWIPEKELGIYSKNYKGKGARQVNLAHSPILPTASGTTFHFAAMSQNQSPFEGNMKHDWGWDEQGSEAAFDGADERTRTYLHGRHDFALTPHKVDGRPDTGAGSWINKVFSGEMAKGHSVKCYEGQVWDVPDWIYPEAQKVKAYEKWVAEPTRRNDQKALREGSARFFGKWHESSGLVIDEFDSSIHVIDPFEIPDHWPRFRGLDHGCQHPAAALWGCVSPGGDVFFYRDFLRTGLVPSQISKEIIELSGNKRRRVGIYRNPKTDTPYDMHEEIQSCERYEWTVFDARAFSTSSSDSGLKLSKIYNMAGLRVTKGSGKDSDYYVPLLKEWFVVDPEKTHFVTGEKGAGRVYIFNTCTDLIRTIKRWIWVERKTKGNDPLRKESPIKKDDDLCDCMKLILQKNPRFRVGVRMGDSEYYDGLDSYEDEQKSVYRPVDRITGY